MFLVVVAVLSMTATFAEDKKANTTNNAAAYDMKVNYDKLGETLQLNIDQMEAVKDVHKTFCREMKNVASASEDERKMLMNKALNKDLKYMHYILSKDQYRKYVMLLNVTLNNRGLNF